MMHRMYSMMNIYINDKYINVNDVYIMSNNIISVLVNNIEAAKYKMMNNNIISDE